MLKLYNSLTKREETFEPLKKGTVTMYTCGPTVYSRPHVGNYASFLMADLLRRWLEHGHGLHVVQAKNITDVGHLVHDADRGDDKVEAEAKRERVHPLMIAKRYEEEYLKDERLLNFEEPAFRPRATEAIPEMIAMIKILLEQGNAYELPDGIYFDISSRLKTPYGTLSGNTLQGLESGVRIDVHAGKRHPADFALWKKCVGENASHVLRWRFATGEVSKSEGEDPESGFPGWHIECSAMSRKFLGERIDIHTGGEDNIFPHHESELAQSEALTGKPFVRFWLHRRRIDLGNQKMSKSLGNVLTLPALLEKGYSPLDLRYYLLSVHYRTHLKFSWKGVDDARKARRKIVEWMEEVRGDAGRLAKGSHAGMAKQSLDLFRQRMDEDLNTPAALAEIFDAMNYYYGHTLFSREEMDVYLQFIALARGTFGCFEQEEMQVPPDVQKLFAEREAARRKKDFALSDELRGEILKRGFRVDDTASGSKLVPL